MTELAVKAAYDIFLAIRQEYNIQKQEDEVSAEVQKRCKLPHPPDHGPDVSRDCKFNTH